MLPAWARDLSIGAAPDATRALAAWSRDWTETEHLRMPQIVAPSGPDKVRAMATALRRDVALVNETLFQASLYARSPEAYRREVPRPPLSGPARLAWMCFPHLLGPAHLAARAGRQARVALPSTQAMHVEFATAWSQGLLLDHTLRGMSLSGGHATASDPVLAAEMGRFAEQLDKAVAASSDSQGVLRHFPRELRDRIMAARVSAERLLSNARHLDSAVLGPEIVAPHFTWAPQAVRQRVDTSFADVTVMTDDLRGQLDRSARIVTFVLDELQAFVRQSGGDKVMRVYGAVYTAGLSEAWIRHRKPNQGSREAIPVLGECREAARHTAGALDALGASLAHAPLAPDLDTAQGQLTHAAATADLAQQWYAEHNRLLTAAHHAMRHAYGHDVNAHVRWGKALVEGFEALSHVATKDVVTTRETEAHILAGAVVVLRDAVRAAAAT